MTPSYSPRFSNIGISCYCCSFLFSHPDKGAESIVMQNFPLDKYRIKVLTAERLKEPTRQLLNDHGYAFVLNLTTWGESLWVHSSVRNELNWTAFETLGFRIA
jgi:hypothetical protein